MSRIWHEMNRPRESWLPLPGVTILVRWNYMLPVWTVAFVVAIKYGEGWL